ncbi:MAG: glycoside hydrolase family 99-like domain-containing protein, partial [Bifidobacteriaceae bacterium]|nr:glycoside hydrolase family 99-like domain-containing protein [Bifidobacteriaceae bacterium]
MSRRPNMTAAVAAVACAVAMVLAGVAPGSTGGLEAAQADTQPADYPLLGTHYFPPWSDTCSTEYLYGGHSTNQWVRLQQYGGDTRRPAEPLGWYKSNTDVAVIDQQLQWMAEAGIDFAAFGWMLNGGEISCMDRVVQAYLDSPNSENVGFAINWIAETDWDRVKTLTAWDRTIAYWIENYFSRPQYLRIGGRPVLMIYNLQMLEADADAIYAADDLPTEQRVKKLLERARSKAAAAGLGGLYIVGQQAPYWRNQPTIEYADRVGLDALSAYNYGPPSNNNALDYAGLDAAYRAKWKDSVLRQVAVSGRVAYWPPMTVGWDDTPIRLSQGETPRLGNATITQFENHLMAGRDFLNNYPVQTGGVAMLAAWNEYEEGSVIEPSASQPPGERYIDAIRRVFAQDPPPSTPSLSAATLNSGANASATRIAVTSNAQWTATNPSGAQWLGIAPTVGTPGGAMTLSVKANQTLQPRRAKVEVRVGTGRPAVIEVTQAANPEATMVGRMEVVSSPAPGTVALHMWVYDPRAMNESVDVDLYVGGRKDEVGAHRYPLGTTDVLRYDIIDAYGLDVPFPRWGFSEKTVDVDDAGTNVEVCAYASPVGTANPQGGSVLLNCLTVTKIEPATRPASADTSSASVTHRPGQVANYSAQGDEWGSQTVSVELVDQAARPVTGAVGKLTIGPGSRDAWLGAGLGYSNGGSFQCAQTPEPDGRCPAGVYEIGVYSAQVGTRILQAN